MSLASSPVAVASVSFLLAAVITTSLVPVVRATGMRFGLTDKPDPRKQHSTPMVRLGGVAMVLASVSPDGDRLMGGFDLRSGTG